MLMKIMNNEELVAHLKARYTYDADAGVVRNRKGAIVKGKPMGSTYQRRKGVVYRGLNIRKNNEYMSMPLHHVVWALCHGWLPEQIDHLNGITTDNRIANLRAVTARENNRNRLMTWKPNATTGLPGVFLRCNSSSYKINLERYYYFRNKYEAFITLTLLGRMYNTM